MDKLTWADALKLRQYRTQAQAGEMSEDDATAVLNEIVGKVTGVDPLTLPANVVNRVVEAIFSSDQPDSGN
jgi:hypothetical protein